MSNYFHHLFHVFQRPRAAVDSADSGQILFLTDSHFPTCQHSPVLLLTAETPRETRFLTLSTSVITNRLTSGCNSVDTEADLNAWLGRRVGPTWTGVLLQKK